jgi:hypothetical protein
LEKQLARSNTEARVAVTVATLLASTPSTSTSVIGGSSSSGSGNKAPKLMCVAELQRELRRRGVNATGEKALLVRRLEQALANAERKSGALTTAAAADGAAQAPIGASGG